MKVHLIRSEGFKMEDYNDVFNILNQYSGGITFVPSEPIVLPDTDIEITYEDEDSYGRQALYDAKETFFEKRSFPKTEKSYLKPKFTNSSNAHILLLQIEKPGARKLSTSSPICCSNKSLDLCKSSLKSSILNL